MPFTDFETTACPYQGEDFDYVVIGAGAVGIMLGVELSRRGRKVLLLDSGHFKIDFERQRFNIVVQRGKELRNALWGRYRTVGGTTVNWGGQSLPFSRLDFEQRSWVDNSGWPIGLDDIAPYYPDANRFLGVDALDYREDMFRRFGTRLPGLDPAIDFHYSKWSPWPDFQRHYRGELERNVPVVYNALVTRLHTDGNGRVTALDMSNYRGSVTRLQVKNLVIAAGGIETNRILLANRAPNGVSIGDHSGWLGRCFMDHPCLETGTVTPRDPWAFQRLMNTNIHRGLKFSKRLSFSEAFQRERRLTHASACFMFTYPEDAFDPYQEILSLRNRKLPDLGRVLRHSGAYASAAWALLRHRYVYKPGAQVRLVMMLEQEPDRSSRIALSDEPDPLGVPKAEVHWHISPKTWTAACTLSDLIGRELQRLGLADYHPHGHVRPGQPDWMDHLHDVNHHMGGTRMSAGPADGVVDTHLKVWGYDNLHLISSSVFPTGSHSNPTLTLLALGQRWMREQAG
jgi:choline dehydrogenase-like flavoprotein